jgi:ABC-type Zn uptake system ZnuABC Zn-binding protein ZnuA
MAPTSFKEKTMKKQIVLGFVLIAVSSSYASKLKVVTTTSDLAAITKEVAGDAAHVDAICSGNQDPHHLQARPKYIMLARNADLWIRVGMDLEVGWEMPVIDGSRNRKIRPGQPGHLDASGHVHKLEIPDTSLLTRAMGDVHAQGNPHYLTDPENAKHVAADIAERLAQLDFEHADLYRANAKAFQDKIDARMVEWQHKMEPLKGKAIITYHKSWIYFADRFGLDIVAELEPKPGVPPSPAHLMNLVGMARSKPVGIILQEPWYSTKAAKRVAGQSGARVVLAPIFVGGDPEATDYCALIDLIIKRLNEQG